VTVGWNQPFFSQNNLTPNGNATANANILYMTTSGFAYYDGDLNYVGDTSFGTYEKISDSPLTVKYTINDGVVWSDGTPVDAADMILFWGAQNGAKYATDIKDEDIVENEDGTTTVPAGAVYMPMSSPSIEVVSQFPVIGDNGRSVTMIFDQPRADWEQSFGGMPGPVAAHAVASLALGTADAAAGKQAILDAFRKDDKAALSKIMDTFNNGFNFDSMPSDPRVYLSNGPFILSDFVQDQFLTLKRNDKYTGDHMPKVDTVTVRFTEDPMSAVTALQNGELDIIAPQSSVDVLAALNKATNLVTTTGVEGTYEHIDLTFNNNGPFDAATYGGDEAKALAVRNAFLKAIPRQEIIDKLIVPLNPAATTRDSFLFVPGSPMYADTVAASGMLAFAQPDIEGAKKLLADAGVATPIDVKFLYGKSNVRRANQFQLISASVAQAGFNLVDNGDDKWGQRLGDGSYDATLFGWQSTSTLMLNSEANFRTNGPNNFGGYSNPEMDKLWDQAGTALDDATNLALAKQIEALLVKDGFGTTSFQFPGVVSHTQRLQNVSTIPLSPTIFWNFWEWDVA
jgi:peptide/nickel transport system substrate-binding protein